MFLGRFSVESTHPGTSGPTVVMAIALLYLAVPDTSDGKTNIDRLRSFDIGGGILSVGWSIPLLFALQEGGIYYDWNSAVIVATLVAGLVCMFIFGVYEAWITYRTDKEPIFPATFLANPVMALLLL